MKYVTGLVLAAFGTAVAMFAACSDDDTAPVKANLCFPNCPVDAAGGDTFVPPTDANAVDSSPAPDAADSSSNADAAPPSPSQCDPTALWDSPSRVASISNSGFDRFGSISADELSVAWATSSGAVYVADRTTATGAFGTPALLGTTAGAGDRVALDPAGVSLIIVAADHGSLIGFERTSAGAAWTLDTSNALSTINAAASGGRISEPVVGVDNRTLYFLLASTPTAVPQLAQSIWKVGNGTWGAPSGFQNSELLSQDATHRRRPTGLSGDNRTLFYFDEVKGLERGAWRNSATAAFTLFLDLPTIPEASPDRFCDAIYSRTTDSDGVGLFIVE